LRSGELGRTTQFTASQVADAMGFMGMAGMSTNEILGAMPDTLNLAAAGALDMGQAANIVTNILAGFGMETSELGGAVDVLSKAFTSSNTDLEMLGQSMKYAGPVANSFGMSFEETAAIMGTFGNAGIQASMAGTTLRQAIIQLNNKAEDFGLTMYDATGKMLPMADILEQLEARGLTAGEMMDLFGARAGPGMAALLEQGSDSLRAFTSELEDSGGTAERIATTQMEGLHGTFINLKSAFEGVQLAIADVLIPILTPLLEKITALFRKFADLPTPIIAATVAFFGLAAAIGPALLVTSYLIKAYQTLTSVFKFAAIATKAMAVANTLLGSSIRKLMAATGIGALLVALGLLVTLLMKNEEVMNMLKEAFEKIMKALQPLLLLFGDMVDMLFRELQPVLDEVTEIFVELAKSVLPIFIDILTILVEIFADVLVALMPLIEMFIKVQTTLLRFVLPIIAALIEKISDFLIPIFETLSGVVKKVWGFIHTWILEKILAVMNAMSTLAGWIPWLGDKIKAGRDAIADMIDANKISQDADIAVTAINKVGDAYKDLGETVQDTAGILANPLEPNLPGGGTGPLTQSSSGTWYKTLPSGQQAMATQSEIDTWLASQGGGTGGGTATSGTGGGTPYDINAPDTYGSAKWSSNLQFVPPEASAEEKAGWCRLSLSWQAPINTAWVPPGSMQSKNGKVYTCVNGQWKEGETGTTRLNPFPTGGDINATFAKGGIIKEPTLLTGLTTGLRGIMAEKGPEAIVPMGQMGSTINISTMVVREEADIHKVARELYILTQRSNKAVGV